MNPKRVEYLFAQIAQPIISHLSPQPTSQDKVFEALNALAIHTALILKATGPDPDAVDFFHQALSEQLHLALPSKN